VCLCSPYFMRNEIQQAPVLLAGFSDTFYNYFSVQTSVTFYCITTMKVLLETVIVVEKRENAYINFHSRLIISALIVWLVGKVWGRVERKVRQKGNMCPHLLPKLQGHCLFRDATNMYCYNYNVFCNSNRPVTVITAFSGLQNVTDFYAGYLICRKFSRKKTLYPEI